MKLSSFGFVSVHCYLQIELSVYVMVFLAVIVISYHCWDWHFQSKTSAFLCTIFSGFCDDFL